MTPLAPDWRTEFLEVITNPTVAYILLLFALTKSGKVPNNSTTWLTIIPYELVLLLGFFIPMQWG